jgi:hypothetical protein
MVCECCGMRLRAGLLQVSINCLKAKGRGEVEVAEVEAKVESDVMFRCNLAFYIASLY